MKPFLASAPLLTLLSAGAFAQPSSTQDDAALRRELESLRERVDQLEGATSPSGSNRLSFSGDLRYRHEVVNDDAAATRRSRQRIRARLDIEADLAEDLTVGITLATGASNPVSANQSLGGGFTRKDIGFDRAYFAWDINSDLKLTGGKMPNPIFRPGGHHLIFDSDLNPEGLALAYGADRGFVTIGGFWVDERSSGEDAILYALQGGYRAMIGDGTALTVGAGYLNYDGTQGHTPFYLGEPRGNSVDAFGNLINDYNLVEVFAQGELEAGGRPLRIFVDRVENTAADSQETGYAFGARWGRASSPGSWDVSWAYEKLEADAVIAAFTDSDFIGGGTDGKGHVFRGTYVVRENVRFNGQYFVNQKGAAAGNEHDYDRLQLDINFRF